MESKNENAAKQIVWDYRQAGLDEADTALCEYAVKLTKTPGLMGQSDVEALRTKGFSDSQITIATQVIGYFNYINRVADGLGVDHEAFMSDISVETWLSEKASL